MGKECRTEQLGRKFHWCTEQPRLSSDPRPQGANDGKVCMSCWSFPFFSSLSSCPHVSPTCHPCSQTIHPVHKSPLPLSLFFSGPNQFTSNLFCFVVPINTHVKCGRTSLHISKCYTEPDTHCPLHMIYLVLVLFSTFTTKLSQNIQSSKVILPASAISVLGRLTLHANCHSIQFHFGTNRTTVGRN